MVSSSALIRESLFDAELSQLRTELQPLRLPAGACVFAQGETGDRMLLITEGEVRSSIRRPDGTDEVLSHAGAGQVVGEIAMLTGSRRAATVTTLTPLVGWTLDRHGFDVLRLDASTPAIAFIRNLITLAAIRLRESCADGGGPKDDQDGPADQPSSLLRFQSGIAASSPIEYLRSLLCFSGFRDPEDVDAAVRDVPMQAAERGEILIEAGPWSPALLLVIRGAIEVTVSRGQDNRRVRLAGPGRLVGHNGILDHGPSPISARARERAVFLSFSPDRVERVLADPSRAARAFSAALLEDTARAVREASRPMVATAVRP